MVNGAGYSRFVGAADRQFNQSRVTALVKLRRSRGNQRTAISGRILPINPTTNVDRSVIRSLSAPRFPTPGPSAGETFADELIPKRSATPNDDPKFASKPILIAISDWSNLERSEEHTSELQSLMRTSYAVFCLKKKKKH